MAYFYAASAVHATIFSTDDKFYPVSNFTWIHTLTEVASSYALLTWLLSLPIAHAVLVHY